MADTKISALPASTTPLAGTEVLPIVQSSTTKKVAVSDLTAGRSVAMANTIVATGSTVVVAGATSGSAATLQSGTGTFSLTGANNRGIGVLINSNQNTNITLPYGGSYEILGLVSAIKAIAGSGYTLYGLAGYAESDGSPIGVRADAKSTVAANPAYGVYVGSVTGATNNYGVYVADTSAVNYFGGNIQVGTAAKGINFTANTGAAGMTSQLLNWYEEGTWTPTFAPSSGAFGSVTYNAIQGSRYTRVGNVVHIQGAIATDAITVGTASNNVWITGLPFTAVANTGSTNNGFSDIAIGYSSNFAGDVPSHGYVAAGTTRIELYYRTTANGASAPLNVSDLSTTDKNYVYFSATYICA